jgi:hypothetical protein
MAKLKGPLLSMRASGQIGKSQVYATWRGVQYVRQLVDPSNPRTEAQTSTRTVFKWLNELYRRMAAASTLPWELYTQGRPMTSRNGLIRINLPALREETDASNLIGSPGARGGPAFTDFEAEPGPSPGQIDYEITPATLPTDWSITRAVVLAIPQQDPHEPFEGPVSEDEVPNPGPYDGTISDLTPAGEYVLTAWLEYEKPDGTFAVSPSATIDATAAAA